MKNFVSGSEPSPLFEGSAPQEIETMLHCLEARPERTALFEGLAPEEIRAMLHCLEARPERRGKGEYLLRAGDTTEAVGLLLSGSVLIVQEDFWGNRNIVSHIAPGQIFAEAFACAPGAALTVSAVAESDSTVVWLNIGRILTTCPTACAHHSRMIRNLVSDLAQKNLHFGEKVAHMGQRTTRAKVLSYLSAEARSSGGASFQIPFSRQQLADYLSVDRSGLSATLCDLRDEGVLRFHKNRFTLLADRD